MQEKENEIKIAKKELANLYLLIKMQKKDNVRDIIFINLIINIVYSTK